jgi:hypothetical protein
MQRIINVKLSPYPPNLGSTLAKIIEPATGVSKFLHHTDKKVNKIFLIYKEIQKGAVAKSNMRKGFLVNEEMRKYLTIHEEAISHI